MRTWVTVTEALELQVGGKKIRPGPWPKKVLLFCPLNWKQRTREGENLILWVGFRVQLLLVRFFFLRLLPLFFLLFLAVLDLGRLPH